MKRWIRLIILLVLGILPAGFYYITGPTAPRGDLTATPAVKASAVAPTITALPALMTSTAVERSTTSSRTKEAGRLIMIDPSFYPEHKLVTFDLATEKLTTDFDVPENGWIYQIDVSQDGRQIVMAYSAPPTSDENQTNQRDPYDRSGIYLLSLDDTTADPILLFGHQQANEYFFSPIWSADGQHIYYVSYRYLSTAGEETPSQSQNSTLDVGLYRYDLQSKASTFIEKNAVWPRLSPNGERLVYILVDPTTMQRGIYIVDTTSNHVTEVVPINAFFDVDTPHFSANGEWLYFSAAPHPTKVSRTWWERVLDVQIAKAHTDHNVPSEWWRVPVGGGEPEKISSTPRLITYGEFNDNGERLFFATDMGIYAMDTNSESSERLPLPNLYKFIIWAP